MENPLATKQDLTTTMGLEKDKAIIDNCKVHVYKFKVLQSFVFKVLGDKPNQKTCQINPGPFLNSATDNRGTSIL